MTILSNIPLSLHTTIQLGGNARYFAECSSISEIREALQFAKEKKICYQIISGGSNIIFSDEGFPGIVIKVATKGIGLNENGNTVSIIAEAGENWDDFVKFCIEKDLSGIECLSGIPGSVGATPVQNVGAYGQEVKDVIESVTVLEADTEMVFQLSNSDCRFAYRDSRFKSDRNNSLIILQINFIFSKCVQPEIRYPELEQYILMNHDDFGKKNLNGKLRIIRESVLMLRKKKSMIIEKSDPDTKSCGSFFKNPVIDKTLFDSLKSKYPLLPSFVQSGKIKIPAAWLIEAAGYHKGLEKNGVGISSNHSLALVNKGGTTSSLLALAKEIETAVSDKFGITLEKEPVII